MRTERLAAVGVIAALIFVAGCVDSPTRAVAPSDGPAFDDGGWTAGSGNRAAPDSGAATVSATGTCEERGGWTAGSGNKTGDLPSCDGAEGL